MAATKLPDHVTLAARFLQGGALSTLLHWLVMATLVQVDVEALYATVCGAFAGAACNYLLQFHLTFESRATHRSALPAYVAVVLMSMAANAGIFYLLHSEIGWGYTTAQLVTSATVMLMNLVLYKKVVFHERRTRTLAP